MVEQEFLITVQGLSLEYSEDLRFIKDFPLAVITSLDIQRLAILASKYNIIDVVTEKNLVDVLKKLNAEIMKRYEKLVIEDVLERIRAETPSRMPKKSLGKVEEINPEEDWKV